MNCNITFSARFHYRANGGVGPHHHDKDYQVQLIYGGTANIVVNDTHYAVKEGDVVFIPQSASHRFQAGREGMKTLEVKFSTQDPEMLDILSHIDCYFSAKDKQLFDLFSRIVDEGLRQAPGYKIMCDALLIESLTVMMRYCSNATPANEQNQLKFPESTTCTSPAIQAANEYIFRHINTNFSIVDLAKGCGYNQDYLYRTIKKAFGISAIQYVNKLRFEQAKRLMEHTDLSLSEIAWNLGFDSIQYFSKFFRQHAGTSPTEYCNRVRSSVRIDY